MIVLRNNVVRLNAENGNVTQLSEFGVNKLQILTEFSKYKYFQEINTTVGVPRIALAFRKAARHLQGRTQGSVRFLYRYIDKQNENSNIYVVRVQCCMYIVSGNVQRR